MTMLKVRAKASMVSFPAPAFTMSDPTRLAAIDCTPATVEFKSVAETRFPPIGRLC